MNYKQIIEREINLWCSAYPSQRKLLRKFGTKIKVDLSLECKELESRKPKEALKRLRSRLI